MVFPFSAIRNKSAIELVGHRMGTGETAVIAQVLSIGQLPVHLLCRRSHRLAVGSNIPSIYATPRSPLPGPKNPA